MNTQNNNEMRFMNLVKEDSYKNIVKNLLKKHGHAGDEDWEQEMQIAFYDAICKYDETRGEFWGYAYFKMSAKAFQLNAKDRLVALPYDAISGTHGHAVERNSWCSIDEENGNTLGEDFIAAEDVTGRISLQQAMETLTPEERYFVSAKHGLIKTATESTDLNKIAEEYGISSTYARKTYKTAVDKLAVMLH